MLDVFIATCFFLFLYYLFFAGEVCEQVIVLPEDSRVHLTFDSLHVDCTAGKSAACGQK